MKCDEYRVLCECVERGVVAGWRRAHKHQDSPPAESIHACIENAVMLAISNYFQFDEEGDAESGNTLDHFPGVKKMVTPSERGLGRTIETWQQRCQQHPDHQQGMVTEQMLRDRMQEEIDDLRSALEAVTNPHGKEGGNLTPPLDRLPDAGKTSDHIGDASKMVASCQESRQVDQKQEKNGSPCPEFWDWLLKAYNFEGDGNFTKYNMEVAFLAGKQSLYPAPPKREPLTEEEIGEIFISHGRDQETFARAIERAHGIGGEE